MESTLRTAYYMINKEKAPDNFYNLQEIRGERDIKEAIVDMKEFKLKIGVFSKVSTVEKYLSRIKEYDFIEVMSCPGGCIGGGGQPLVAINNLTNIREKRINSIYNDDRGLKIKESYMNPEIRDAYDCYINKKNVELHTNHKN